MNDQTIIVDIDDIEERLSKKQSAGRYLSLTYLSGPALGKRMRLDQPRSYSLGRSEGSDVRLDEPSVSRTHAILDVQSDGQMTLTDCGSSNGTFVDGVRLTPNETRRIQGGVKIAFGDQAVVRIDLNDELDERVQTSLYEAAVKDGLTGVFNKRYLLENVGRELALAQRHRVPISLVIFDVDHFKKINDTHGHLAGDLALKRVAQVVACALRTEDLLARYGGEEFVVLVKHQALPAAVQLAERLRLLIQNAEVTFDGARIPITVSLGVTSTSVKPYASAEDMIHDADTMLYEAKRGGRNRCVACPLKLSS